MIEGVKALSYHDKELQAGLVANGCDYKCRSDLDLQGLFARIQSLWPNLRRVSDAYDIEGAIVVERVAANLVIFNFLDVVGRERRNATAVVFGDDLTDRVYEIPITEQSVEALMAIPQHTLMFLEDDRVLLVLSFEGDLIILS